jgi:hypothetical protein
VHALLVGKRIAQISNRFFDATMIGEECANLQDI